MKKFYRTLTFEGKTWFYKIGKRFVLITSPWGSKITVDFPTLLDSSLEAIERGKQKKYFSVTPQDIKNFIQNKVER